MDNDHNVLLKFPNRFGFAFVLNYCNALLLNFVCRGFEGSTKRNGDGNTTIKDPNCIAWKKLTNGFELFSLLYYQTRILE
jgi:hypothetical protein